MAVRKMTPIPVIRIFCERVKEKLIRLVLLLRLVDLRLVVFLRVLLRVIAQMFLMMHYSMNKAERQPAPNVIRLRFRILINQKTK